MERINVEVPKELKLEFKIACEREETTMRKKIIEMVTTYLTQQISE